MWSLRQEQIGGGTTDRSKDKTLRTTFHEQLTELVADTARMCAGAAEMNNAATLLLFDDEHLGETLHVSLRTVSRAGRSISDHAFSLLALQAPVASELRAVVATLHIVRDIDRMAGLAANVARIAVREEPRAIVPTEARDVLREMSTAAAASALGAQRAIESSDQTLARRMEQADCRMNVLNRQLFEIVMQPDWPHGTVVAADLVLVSRFYERYADHAVNIARHIYFQSTGDHVSLVEPAEPTPRKVET